MMTFTSDIYAVMAQLNNVLRQIYTQYFKAELSALRNASRHTLAELRHESLDCCLQVLKDFGLCPYVVNRKLSFYVWHSVQMTIDRRDATELLTNDPNNSLIVPSNTGKAFTFAQFVVFFYRVCIFAFDLTDHGEHIQASQFNLVKKLLYVLQKLERS